MMDSNDEVNDLETSEQQTSSGPHQMSQAEQSAEVSNMQRNHPQTSDDIRLKYPSRDGTYLSQLYNQPLVTTLTSFSQVANLVRNPYELINNVDEFVRHASGNNRRNPTRRSENFAKMLNQNRHSLTPDKPTVLREMDTFVADGDSTLSDAIDAPIPNQQPIPALPPINASKKRARQGPLTIEEYETKFRESATDIELIDRVFAGSLACNQLRATLWPYLFGLVVHRGRFDKICAEDGKEAYIFIDHEANNKRWSELKDLYSIYQAQWTAILPEQEQRFSTFRERKSLIERDVIRCDRLHMFYSNESQHLTKLTNLLMTYMMYDFDIGYVQGMSDIAGPILCIYNGDLVKSFWIFVEVMKLLRRNFELTQKTIHFQLNCLYELVKNTDQEFAKYLEENDSANCFFAFRAIVCQFKRELMKEDEDDYTNVLFLWDTIWCVDRRVALQMELDKLTNESLMFTDEISEIKESKETNISDQQILSPENAFAIHMNPNQADSPRYKLTETEIFVLSLCLSMIRRERDLIMANRLDGTDIHLHFIDPKLANNLNGFIEHAINIYTYLKNDFDLTKLTSPKSQQQTQPPQSTESAATNINASPISVDGYDSLSDFLIINGAGT